MDEDELYLLSIMIPGLTRDQLIEVEKYAELVSELSYSIGYDKACEDLLTTYCLN